MTKYKIKWDSKIINGVYATFKWNTAPTHPNSPRYTWNDVQLIIAAAGEDFNVWEQKDKDKLVKLILKLNVKTITESKRKQIKQYKIKVSDIKLAIENISNVEIITENIKF